jgi:transcriptional regulator with XRE-family HTH domain
MPETWWEYVERISGGIPQKDIARAAGIDQTMVSRWKTAKHKPKAENVVQFARGLGRSPVEALIAAGYIREDEVAQAVETRTSVTELPSTILLGELARRLSTPPTLRPPLA